MAVYWISTNVKLSTIFCLTKAGFPKRGRSAPLSVPGAGRASPLLLLVSCRSPAAAVLGVLLSQTYNSLFSEKNWALSLQTELWRVKHKIRGSGMRSCMSPNPKLPVISVKSFFWLVIVVSWVLILQRNISVIGSEVSSCLFKWDRPSLV